MTAIRSSLERFMCPGVVVRYVLLLLFLLPGCGGGSTGTGVLPITGIARTGAGEPIVGMVIDAETANSEDQDVTGDDGSATFEVILDEASQVQFQFFSPTIQASELLSNIPTDATSVTVEWTFAEDGVTTRVTYTFANRDPVVLEMFTPIT